MRIVFRHSRDYDMEMWKYATHLKTRSPDPKLGWVHRPNQHGRLMGVDVATNAFGLRGGDVTIAKPAGTYRIVVIGDSFTMGWGVPQRETFVADLERLLNTNPPPAFPPNVHFEVLNLGVGNYNTVQEVQLLRTLGMTFTPDLILLAWFLNDAEPLVVPRTNVLAEHSYLAAFVLSRIRRISVSRSSSLDFKAYYQSLYTSDQPGWIAEQSAFHELGDLGRQSSTPVRAFLIPDLHDLSAAYPFREIHSKVIRLGDDSGVPVTDLLPGFTGFSPETRLWVTSQDAHANSLGQSIIAKGIYASLASAPPDRSPLLNSAALAQR